MKMPNKLDKVNPGLDKCKATYEKWTSRSSELVDNYRSQVRSEGIPKAGEELSEGWKEVGKKYQEVTALRDSLTENLRVVWEILLS